MFDVLWTDPNRELVGERILRKEREEREGRTKEKDRKKNGSTRHSVSTNSSSSSEKGFGFFAGKNRKKATTSSKSENATSSSADPMFEDAKDRRGSAYGVKALLNHEDDSAVTVKPANSVLPPVQSPEPVDGCSSLSSRGMCCMPAVLSCATSLISRTARISPIQMHPALSYRLEHPSQYITKRVGCHQVGAFDTDTGTVFFHHQDYRGRHLPQ